MSIDPVQLLRQLERPVRPASAPSAGGPGRPPIEASGFDELMALVAGRSLSSDRAITVGADAVLPNELSNDDKARLASAADVAEAAGAARAVMLMNGRGFVMDVGAREITGELSSGHDLVNLDAAVYVAGSEESSPVIVPPPADGVLPAGVARRLEVEGALESSLESTSEPTSARRAG